MFRGVAAAGLSITLGLVAASAFAGTAAAAPTATGGPVASAAHKPAPGGGGGQSGGSSRSGGSSGSGGKAPTAGNVPLPGPTQQCDPSPKYKPQSGTPWAQQALDYSSVWKFTQGAGVTVAVIDSGVDANPQFGSRVSVGPMFAKAPSGPAYADCVGHGTMVAGIIAAAPRAGTPFAGVAPQAHILSIKVTNSEGGISSTTLASAIGQAIMKGAQVINVSIDTPVDSPDLRGIVNYALQHNIVVVAAVGNDEPPADGTGPPTHGPFYPADYPGVLSVGAVDADGNLASFSDKKTNVSVTAPGKDITSTFPGTSGDSYAADDGTSFAAPFVSGEVALVRSRYPNLSAQQVARRITETADGPAGAGTGNGLINPVQAVTAVLPRGAAAAGAAAARPGPVSVNRAAPNRSEKMVAASLAGGAFAVAALVIAAAVVIPAGRRRGWRPGERA